MSGLLVSVRSAIEAETALAGGASLIDVKEPARGPLGFAGWNVIGEVVAAVAGRAPVSAALGELMDWPTDAGSPIGAQLSFVKWGLAGAANADWRVRLGQCRRDWPAAVAVAYADWQRADAPSPEAVAGFAVAKRFAALLVDTWGKDGTTLLDWFREPKLRRLVADCRRGGVRVALAGSLSVERMERLLHLAPDWFAVRGAACEGGRGGTVVAERVRQMGEVIQDASAKSR